MSQGQQRIRLQRFLAQAGVASRRKAEALIDAGRVRVNGRRVVTQGTQVDPDKDKVEVDGRRVYAETRRYLLLHKPPGYLTTLEDPEGRPTVRDLLPVEGPRLYPVGRLDFNSEGALLCTNDGELAHALAHPSRQVKKTYRARVRGQVTEAQIETLSRGVDLEDGRSAPALVLVRAETASHTWLEITVHEGRNRLIRRMCEALGLPVMRLIRSVFAGLEVEALHRGAWRELTAKEVAKLRRLAGLSAVKTRTQGSRSAPGARSRTRKRPDQRPRTAPPRRTTSRKAKAKPRRGGPDRGRRRGDPSKSKQSKREK